MTWWQALSLIGVVVFCLGWVALDPFRVGHRR